MVTDAINAFKIDYILSVIKFTILRSERRVNLKRRTWNASGDDHCLVELISIELGTGHFYGF